MKNPLFYFNWVPVSFNNLSVLSKFLFWIGVFSTILTILDIIPITFLLSYFVLNLFVEAVAKEKLAVLLAKELPGQLAQFQDEHVGDTFFIESIASDVGIIHARHINSGRSRWYRLPKSTTRLDPNETVILGKENDKFIFQGFPKPTAM